MKRKIVKFTLLLSLLLSGFYADAQNWLPGYRYRKLITIQKSKIENDITGHNQLINFNVLLQLEHADLQYDEGAFENKITHPMGLDISFALATVSGTALKFQLENYDPTTGKIACWIKIPSVVTKSSKVVSTAIYMYYGSTTYHDPASPAAWGSWDAMYSHVDHLNDGAEGMITSGASFNGNRRLLLKTPIPAIFSLSVWIKLQTNNQEQMIIANDTAGIGGFQLKVNTGGKLVLQAFNAIRSWSLVSSTTLQAGQWYLVSFYYRSPSTVIRVNGIDAGFPGTSIQMAIGGQVAIGGSKQQNQYFNGSMDELRISAVEVQIPWIITEYNMIKSPDGLFTAGVEELNATLATTFTFTGALDNSWLAPENWIPKVVPPLNKNIRIKAGAWLQAVDDVSVNKLLLESGAQLTLAKNFYAAQRVELQSGSVITSLNTSTMLLEGDFLNHGSLLAEGKLLFRGNQNVLKYSGTGQARVAILEVDLAALQASVNLQSLLKISHSLNLLKGLVLANGNILLLATASQTAAVGPLGAQAGISGDVQVQSYVNGAFPAPATGRGWRLLSAPVRRTGSPENFYYRFSDLQQAVFLTGSGGTANGFDASPNNGATIYTHDQSLIGTLAQKYVPIPNMAVQIPIGRGFFIYSRGSRVLPDAFLNQVLTPPFSNAAPYTITYKGQLFTGNLDVSVANRDADGEGDGFNLLGNPYASPIKWGSLQKSNVGPFVWLFDPLNNTYIVSDDPNTLIPAGAGFFIRVLKGAKTGNVHFSESAKSNLSL